MKELFIILTVIYSFSSMADTIEYNLIDGNHSKVFESLGVFQASFETDENKTVTITCTEEYTETDKLYITVYDNDFYVKDESAEHDFDNYNDCKYSLIEIVSDIAQGAKITLFSQEKGVSFGLN